MSASIRRTGARALLVAAALCASTHAQSPVSPQPAQFRGGANFVRVDVHAMIDGVPVQDLTAADFEVFEDGVPQAIQSFEHITITPAALSRYRTDPATVEAARQLAASGRHRILVLFLDAPHVSADASIKIAEPLIRMLDRVVGDDDLIGVMTPDMRISDLTLGRKTDVLERLLRGPRGWGRRFDRNSLDAQEELYVACYSRLPTEVQRGKSLPGLALGLIERRRERMTLEALRALVTYLGALHDERKAILTITEGWRLHRADDALLGVQGTERDRNRQGPEIEKPHVGPDGRLTLDPPVGTPSSMDCEADRMRLATMDNEWFFRQVIGDANRANASFYTIDPRGLAVFDIATNWDTPPEVVDPMLWDQYVLKGRNQSIRELAENTDGVAVVNVGSLDKGLARITADLTSYYLLGYSSSNTRLDGTFRRITVKVRRPDVDVRARRGYRAATEEEIAAARAPTPLPIPVPESVGRVNAALAELARTRHDTPFRINAVLRPGAQGVSSVWVAGEIRGAKAFNRTAEGQVQIEISGAATASTTVSLPPDQQSFLAEIPLDTPARTGTLDVRARLNGIGVIPFTDNVRVDAAGAPRALLFRRGPSTGNRVQPAGDPQFSRTERVHVEVPIAPGDTPGVGRLLDRAGNPLAIPVVIGERTDAATGQRWLTADVRLAALTLGDYVVEVGGRVITAIRVTR